ncbi:MAG TPA: MFS transporter, partial [Planctomycetota bacterium]|nr:MFS transporter [Planctomycetota bacterium]
MRVPPSYVRRDASVVRADLVAVPDAAWWAEGTALEGARGRGAGVVVLDLPGGLRGVARTYRRGGALAALLRERFADPARPARELGTLLALRAANVAAVEPLAALARRDGWLWRLRLVTALVEGARPLPALIAARPDLRRIAVARAGALVGAAFAAGLVHPDLHPDNLIAAPRADGVEVWLVDLDRARIGPPVPPARRIAMLARMARYLERHRATLPVQPTRTDALRFLAALGMGGEWALGVALVMEIWPTKSRPLMAGMIGAAANVGFLVVALVSLGLNNVITGVGGFLDLVLPTAAVEALLANGAWRMLFLLGAVPAFMTLFIRLFVPESERWHEAVKKSAEGPKVRSLFQGSQARRTVVGAALGAVALLGTWGSVQWIPSWGDKLSGGLPGARGVLQMWSAVGAILFSLLAGVLADKLNRRVTYFLLCTTSLVACAILFRLPMSYGQGLFFWTFLVGGLSASFYGWLPLYLPE